MNPQRPEPGSPWAKHCPDAAPRAWIVAGKLPDGFTRPATPDEAELILGRIREAEFLRRTGKAGTPSPVVAGTKPPRKGHGKGKPSPVVAKLLAWNRFLDGLRDHEPRLHPLAVALMCWLLRCAKDGKARASERRLADRFGVGRDTIRRHLRTLADAGFLAVARRGVHGRSATVYRIRPVPKVPKTTTATTT